MVSVASEAKGPPDNARSPRMWESYGAWLWLIGIVQFFVAMLLVELAYGCANFGGCYNALTNPIGDLGSGGFSGNPAYFIDGGVQHAWPYSQLWPVFDYSIFVLGAFLVAGVLLLQGAFPRKGASRVSLAFLGMTGLGAAGVGVVPEDTLLAAHSAFAFLALAGSGLAVLVMGVALARDREWGRGWGLASFVLGLISLVTLLVLLLPSAGVVPSWRVYGSGFGSGGLERLIVAAPALWLIGVTTRVLWRRRAATSPVESRTAASSHATSVPIDASSRRLVWENYGAWIWLLGLLQFVAVMVASQLAYSCSNYGGCYNFLSNPISDFGSAGFTTGNPPQITYMNLAIPWPTALLWPVFNYSIVLFGTCLFSGAFLVRSAFPQTSWSVLGLALFGVGGMGAAGVGIVPEDTLFAAHSSFALIAFGLAAIGVLTLGIALAVGRSWGRRWTVYTLASGIFALLVMVIFSVPSLVGVSAWAPYGSAFGYGGMERLITVAPLLWIGVAMVHLLHRPARASDGSGSGSSPDALSR